MLHELCSVHFTDRSFKQNIELLVKNDETFSLKMIKYDTNVNKDPHGAVDRTYAARNLCTIRVAES